MTTIKLALIEGGLISTVSLHSDGNPYPPGNWMPLEQAMSEGFQPRPKQDPISETIPLFAFRAAVKKMGLMDRICAAIESADEPPRIVAWEQLEYGNNVSRGDDLVAVFRQDLGLTDEVVDQIFKLGASLCRK